MSELKINPEALQHLQANERFSHIYLNDNGGWLFVPHPEYRTAVSREEALKGLSGTAVKAPADIQEEAPADIQEEDEVKQNSKKSNKK
jgi:hypothetical protein